MTPSVALTEYLYSKDFSPKSQTWYEQHLRLFFDWTAQHQCPLHQPLKEIESLTPQHLREFLASLRTTPSARYGRLVSTHTQHAYMRAIKAFVHWAIAEGWLTEKVLRNVEMPKVEQKVINVFTAEHIDQLFAACKDEGCPQLEARDKAIVAVLLDTGLRAAELCTLTLDRVTFNRDEAFLTVQGKGRKQRQVGLGKKSRLLLHRYLYAWRERLHPTDEAVNFGNATQPVWVRGKDTVFLAWGGTPLHPEGLDRMLYRLRDKAGITGVRVSAHTFRHWYALNYMRNGGDVYKLSRLLGHTSVAVTENYLRAFRAEDARRGSSVLDSIK